MTPAGELISARAGKGLAWIPAALSEMPVSTPLFPLFLDLSGRLVLVVGGGSVAARKIQPLMDAGAHVRVGALSLADDVAQWASDGRIEFLQGPFDETWLDGAWLVVAATDHDDVNHQVAAAATQRRIWVNVVDDARLSAFHVPARIERGPLQIAISSGGGAPMLARHLRERLETEIDESFGPLAEMLSSARVRIRARYPRPAERRAFFDELLAGPLPGLLRQGQNEAAALELDSALDKLPLRKGLGRVALVGAGPGDPGLLTLRALRVLNQADVILHDHLASDAVLQLARRDAQRIDVGKRARGRSTSQDDIHALMLEHARAGRRVVRLKGGDPFIFGRGGEELQFLRNHGIHYEVVPDITAALACAAYAGIPLTHRELAQSVRLMTAQRKESWQSIDWQALSRDGQTLAVYMGVSELKNLRAQLLAHGRDPSTPFALIENGSRPEQRVITGRLDEMPERAVAEAVVSPALLILGEVAALAKELHWFGEAPLDGASALDLSRAA